MNHWHDITSFSHPGGEGGRRPDEGESPHPLWGNSGSVMLEFVIAFPLVLVLMFACIQFSEIWIARMVVHYGAFCAARSALVCRSDEYPGNNSAPSRAATNVCWLLQQKWGIASIPANDRNSTDVRDDGWNVKATHTFKFSLITPIVGDIIAFCMTPWHEDPTKTWIVPENRELDGLKYPFITLKETVVLPKPYKTMVPSGL
jgi:TadE-like protein